MAYGVNTKIAPSIGKANLADVDIYKIGLMCECERGVDQIAKEIYSMSDFEEKCGSYASDKYGWYIANSFFNSLDAAVSVEMKVLPFVSSDAVQAVDEIMDTDATPEKVFDIKAGFEGEVDKSAFGNRIGWKVENSENISYELSVDTGATPTSAVLTNVEHLKVGYYVRFLEGANDETAVILTLDEATKTITFAALTNAYTAVGAAITRLDWSLKLGLKDVSGVYNLVEEWNEYPFFLINDTEGMQKEVNINSKYVTLAANAANTSDADKQRPAVVSTWTALTNGSDGTSPVDSDWNTLLTDFDDEEFTILLAPESSSSDHNSNMCTKATSLKKYIYYAQASNGATESNLKSLCASLRQSVVFGMLPMDKWMEITDQLNGSKKMIPPVGHAAAHYFNIYSMYGIGRVAAGNQWSLLTSDKLDESNGLIHDDKAGKGNNLIRNYSVNICRYRAGKGITINSARTFSTDGGYMYQNQIMGWLLIRKSIEIYFQTVEQNPSGLRAQEQHRNTVWAFLKKKFDSGVFYIGENADGTPTDMDDVVTIVNDFSINSLSDIAQGKESMFVQVIFVPPIEEIWLNLASAAVTSI